MSLPATTLFGAPRDRLAFALDVPSLAEARRWLETLAPTVGVFKVGLELFVREGPAAVALVHDAGARCFLDLKLHDIPNTVAGAVRAALRQPVAYLTVHASGGPSMLAAAQRACAESEQGTTLLGVTALTSLDASELRALGLQDEPSAVVARWATLALGAGLGGLVCSPHEVAALRAMAPRAVLVTPGIRAAGHTGDDQQRVATAAQAIRAGADLVVVGRPLREAANPLLAARALADEIAGALS